MVSRRTRVASWIFRRDHPSRPKAMICCFFSSFKTFAMLREATYPPAAVNVLDVSSESMAAFQVFLYGRFWVFTEDMIAWHLRRRKESRNAGEHREVMEILSPLLRVEVEMTETALRDMANQMAAMPHISRVQGKRGSIKRYLVNGKLPPAVTLTCKKCGNYSILTRDFTRLDPG